jgi:hypothetical protein
MKKHEIRRMPDLLVDVVLRGDCKKRKRCPEVRGKGKLDTGAANTFVSEAVAKRLGLKRVGKRSSRGVHDVKFRNYDVYGVDLGFPGRGLRGVSLLQRGAGLQARHDRVALIGRDAMAAAGMHLEYDAPSGRFKVSRSR